MRSKLSILTIIWMIAGMLCFPALYLIGAFSTDNIGEVQRALVVCVLLFYLQLIIQSIVALASLKRVRHLRRYLVAVLFILLPPFALLLIGLGIGMYLISEPLLQATLYGTLFLQIFGSIWMWLLIGTASKQPLVVTQQLPNIPQLETTPTTQPASLNPSSSRKSHKLLGVLLILTPVFFFILSMILMAITFKTHPEYYTLSLTTSSHVGKLADIAAGLSGVLFIPCVVIGIILIVRSSHKSGNSTT